MIEPLTAEQRATKVFWACEQGWKDGIIGKSYLNGYKLVIDGQPGWVRDHSGDGDICGVDAWVRLFDPRGTEVRIDPHRRIINPPTIHNGMGGDSAQAWLQAVWDSVIQAPNPSRWNKYSGGTVDTFFSATTDGDITSTGITYGIARAGTGTVTANTSATDMFCGQQISPITCYETFVSFDTSAIADSDVVSSVTLSLWLLTDSSATDFTIEARDFDWGASLTTADFVAGANLGSSTLVASLSTSGIGGTGAYKTLTSVGAFNTVTNIKTGTVHLIVDSSRQVSGDAPSGNEFITTASADTAGTTNDPKLTVTHSNPLSSPFFTSRPLRIYRRSRI